MANISVFSPFFSQFCKSSQRRVKVKCYKRSKLNFCIANLLLFLSPARLIPEEGDVVDEKLKDYLFQLYFSNSYLYHCTMIIIFRLGLNALFIADSI